MSRRRFEEGMFWVGICTAGVSVILCAAILLAVGLGAR